MSDPASRALIVVVIVVAALLMAAASRRMGRARGSDVDAGGLGAGLYFFSSATCAGCGPARDLLTSRLGVDGFTEFEWSRRPDLFKQFAVDEVPTTLVVGRGGRAVLFTGSVEEALASLNP